jgi:hypothetical protein
MAWATSVEDIRIGVINEGDSPRWDATFFWDGKPIRYRTKQAGQKDQPITVIPLHIAYEHWAVTLDDAGRLVRATERKADEKESQFERKLAGLCPKVFMPTKDYEGNIMKDQGGRILGSYVNDPAYEDWFTNKVKFKMKKIPVVTTAEEWSRI